MVLLRRLICTAAVTTLLLAPPLSASSSSGAIEPATTDLTEISLDELTQIKVTSVSKKEQDLTRAAAAVFVVTSEDIRRSGATSLPEALRLVPGVYVARIDGSKWSVTARGFGGRYANKLIVLIDGRSLYSPMFGGVFWEMYDGVMEDIDRIEVIRGPAATMWGSNAVNGVINVVTKSASQTQGSLVSMSGGTRDGGLLALRQGGEIVGGHYRIYAKYQNYMPSPDPEPGVGANDDWTSMRAGFRFEKSLSKKDELEVHAEMSQMDGGQRRVRASLATGETLVEPAPINGTSGYLLGRWRHSISERSELTVQSYFDHLDRREEGVFDVEQNTGQFELQHRWSHPGSGELSWGFDFRRVWIDISPLHALRIPEEHPKADYSSVFVQEEWKTADDTVVLTGGLKLEHNTFGGFSPAPSARVLWAPKRVASFWASISRSPRAPSFLESSAEFDVQATSFLGRPALVSVVQSAGLTNEVMTAKEVGARLTPLRKLSFDIALFRNRYDDAYFLKPGDPQLNEAADGLRFLRIPLSFTNGSPICSRGIEAVATWSATDSWRLTGTYSFMKVLAHQDRSNPIAATLSHLQNPKHMASLRSSWNLPGNIELDTSAAFVDTVVASGYLRRGEQIGSFVRADTRFQWRLTKRARLSLGVHNLFDARRYEYDPESFSIAAPVGRNVYGGILWSF